jgi:hypothetical protein
MKAFGDGALSNLHFPKAPPPGGVPAGARSRRMPPRAAQPLGSVSPTPLSSSFYLSSMRWTALVPMRSDLATFSIPTPFASCCRTFRSVALSMFGRPSFTGQPIRRDLQLVRQIIVEKGFWCQRAAESPHFGARNFPHLAGWRSAVCVISASVFRGSTAALDRRVRGRPLDQSIRADVLGNKIGVLTEAVA